MPYLVGWQQCTGCRGTHRTMYPTTTHPNVPGYECPFCGDMTCYPIEQQVPSLELYPDITATRVMDDILDRQYGRAVDQALRLGKRES